MKRYDRLLFARKFLLVAGVFLTLFAIAYNPNQEANYWLDVRLFFGIVSLTGFVLSYFSKYIRQHLINILQTAVYITTPYMTYTLYLNDFDAIWLIFHCIMFSAFSALFTKKSKYLLFLLEFLICFSIGYFWSIKLIPDKVLIGFLFMAYVSVNYILMSSFIFNLSELGWNATRLARQNRALRKFAFMNAHEIRGPLARVLGLTYLLRLERKDSEELILLENAVNELDGVLRKTQIKLETNNVSRTNTYQRVTLNALQRTKTSLETLN